MSLLPNYTTHSTFSTLLQDQNKYAQLCSAYTSSSSSTEAESDHAMDYDDEHMVDEYADDFANSIEITFVEEECVSESDENDTFSYSMNICGNDEESFSWNSAEEREEFFKPKKEHSRRLSFFESVSVVSFEEDEPPQWIQYNKHDGKLTILSHIHKGIHAPHEPKNMWCSLRSLNYRQPCHLIGKITALKSQESLDPLYLARISFDKWQTFLDVETKLVSYSACDRFLFYEFVVPLSEELCFDGDVHFELVVYSTRTPQTIEFMDDCDGQKYIGHIELSPVPCEGLRPLKEPAPTKSLDKMLCDTSFVLTSHVFQL